MDVGFQNDLVWRTGNHFLYGSSSFAPHNDDKLFFASAAGAGEGRWYIIKQTDHNQDDWKMYVWNGVVPADNSETESGWSEVTIANENYTNSQIGSKDTDRVLCAWDDTNLTLHYVMIHLAGQAASDQGARYNKIVLTPSLSVADADIWTGRGSNSSKSVVHPDFCNVLYESDHEEDTDETADANWPIQGDRFSIAIEPPHASITTWPRVWVSFLYADGSGQIGVYANCSLNDDYTTWEENTGTSDFDGDSTEFASDSLGDYMAIVADTGMDNVGGAGEAEDIHNDVQAKLVSGVTSGTPFIACVYNDTSSGNRWLIKDRSTVGAPSAGSPGFGSATAIYTEANGLSHEMNIRSYVPIGTTTSNLTFAAADNAHNVHIAVRDAGTWSDRLITETTDRGYPQMVGDPSNNNLFIFSANHGNGHADGVILDYHDTCMSYEMKVVHKDELEVDLGTSSWTQVIKRGDDTVSNTLAPIPYISRTSPIERSGSDQSTSWLGDSGIMVLTFETVKVGGLGSLNWRLDNDGSSGGWLDQDAAGDDGRRYLRFLWNNIDVDTFEGDSASNQLSVITLTEPIAGQTITVGDILTIEWTAS